MYKLRILINATQINVFLLNNDAHHPKIQAKFMSFLIITAFIPTPLTLLLNTYSEKKLELVFRIVINI